MLGGATNVQSNQEVNIHQFIIIPCTANMKDLMSVACPVLILCEAVQLY